MCMEHFATQSIDVQRRVLLRWRRANADAHLRSWLRPSSSACARNHTRRRRPRAALPVDAQRLVDGSGTPARSSCAQPCGSRVGSGSILSLWDEHVPFPRRLVGTGHRFHWKTCWAELIGRTANLGKFHPLWTFTSLASKHPSTHISTRSNGRYPAPTALSGNFDSHQGTHRRQLDDVRRLGLRRRRSGYRLAINLRLARDAAGLG